REPPGIRVVRAGAPLHDADVPGRVRAQQLRERGGVRRGNRPSAWAAYRSGAAFSWRRPASLTGGPSRAPVTDPERGRSLSFEEGPPDARVHTRPVRLRAAL